MPEAQAFRSQTQTYDESRRFGAGSLKDRIGRPEESNLQISRPDPDETVTRKASEHKSAMQEDANSLADLENTAWPEWKQTPYNWSNYGGYPGYEYYSPDIGGYAGWGPISRYNWRQPYPDQPAEELLYLKGCALSGSSIIRDCTKTYKYIFAFRAGNVVYAQVFGDADLVSPTFSHKNVPKSVMDLSTPTDPEIFGATRIAPDEEKSHYAQEWYDEHMVVEYNKYPPDIIIKPYEDAEYGSKIRIKVYVKLVQNDMLYDGWCEKTVSVACGCRDAVPEIYATGGVTTMGASESLNMWVNSLVYPNIYAVPPFKWSLSGGVGFSLSKTETNDEYEVNVLSTTAVACRDTVVTVTDICGVADTYNIHNTSGHWELKDTCSQNGGDGSEASYYDLYWEEDGLLKRREVWAACCDPAVCGSGSACCSWLTTPPLGPDYCSYCSTQTDFPDLTSTRMYGKYYEWECP